MNLKRPVEGKAGTVLGTRGEGTDALGLRSGGQAVQLGGAGRGHGLLEQLSGEGAVGALLVGLDNVAIRHYPTVGVDDGPAPELADRSRPDDRGRPVAAAHRRRRADTHHDHDDGRLGAEDRRLELRLRRGLGRGRN